MLEHLTRSFGPTFWNHVIFCFVKMGFTNKNLEDWAWRDYVANLTDQSIPYGNNLAQHRINAAAELTHIAEVQTKKHFGSITNFQLSIPDLQQQIVYIDVYPQIRKSMYEMKIDTCNTVAPGHVMCEATAAGLIKRHQEWLDTNSKMMPQFDDSMKAFVKLTSVMSKKPFTEPMLNAEDRLYEVAKVVCTGTSRGFVVAGIWILGKKRNVPDVFFRSVFFKKT